MSHSDSDGEESEWSWTDDDGNDPDYFPPGERAQGLPSHEGGPDGVGLAVLLQRLQGSNRFTLDAPFDASSLGAESLDGCSAEWLVDVDGIQAMAPLGHLGALVGRSARLEVMLKG
eukprot:g6116.t1